MMSTMSYEIDGMKPGAVERPTTVSAAGEILAAASGDGLAVAPVGGGGALHLGNPIERYDIALDMRGLDRIIEHQPTDLVLSVEAGVTLADVSELLSTHGQWLPIEAPYPERATIGGLIATALSGPGRATHGSLRDSLIGIAVASPTGGIAKAGGMVVKNVSGFDLMRLHHGALGTLGVIVSANFKVLPRPQGEVTLLLEVDGVAEALASYDVCSGLEGRPTAAVIERDRSRTTTVAIRYQGRSSQVKAAIRKALTAVRQEGRVLAEDESRDWWRGSLDRLAPSEQDEIEMRFGSRMSGTAGLVERLDSSAQAHDISQEQTITWPDLGTVITSLPTAGGQHAVHVLAQAADTASATWRISRAPVDVKQGRDVWGRSPAALDTLRRLKDEFDPRRTLNPGRFCGHI